MSEAMNESCPFCGASLKQASGSCPSCDLPLAGSSPARSRRRSPALFDGASLFDDTFPEHGGAPPQLGGGDQLPAGGQLPTGEHLRCVVVAINESEAEMLCEMLRSEGLPSIVRSPGLNSYAQGSLRCEVLVPEAALPAARQLLRIEAAQAEGHEPGSRMAAAVVMAMLLAIATALALLITLAA